MEKKCLGGIAHSKLEFVKEKYGNEGLDRMLARMKELGYDGPTRIDEIKLMRWYPFEHNLLFLKAFRDLFGDSAYRRMARGAPGREKSINMFIGWSRSPEKIIQGVESYWHKFFNFGTLRGEMLGTGHARLVGRGIYSGELFCEFLTEYYAGLLEYIGARGVEVKKLKCEGQGADRCLWDVRWRVDGGTRSLAWDSSLETGIDEIDRQHRYFVRILNDINENLRGNYRSTFIHALKFMDHYAHWHFESEEKYMKKYNYPHYEAHRREHQKFYEYTDRIRKRAEKEGITPGLVYEVDKYLIDWLISHIKGTDRRFAEFLASKNLEMPEEPMPEEMKKQIKK